jgi:hypothetical protein
VDSLFPLTTLATHLMRDEQCVVAKVSRTSSRSFLDVIPRDSAFKVMYIVSRSYRYRTSVDQWLAITMRSTWMWDYQSCWVDLAVLLIFLGNNNIKQELSEY